MSDKGKAQETVGAKPKPTSKNTGEREETVDLSLLLDDPLPLLELVESFLKLTLSLNLQLELSNPLISLVKRSTKLVPLLLQANVSRGCIKLLAVVWLKHKKGINKVAGDYTSHPHLRGLLPSGALIAHPMKLQYYKLKH